MTHLSRRSVIKWMARAAVTLPTGIISSALIALAPALTETEGISAQSLPMDGKDRIIVKNNDG